MIDIAAIKKHAKIIGADGVPVGTVDHVEADRIKLTKTGSGDQKHHFIPLALIAGIEDGVVQLSANADVAILLEDPESPMSA